MKRPMLLAMLIAKSSLGMNFNAEAYALSIGDVAQHIAQLLSPQDRSSMWSVCQRWRDLVNSWRAPRNKGGLGLTDKLRVLKNISLGRGSLRPSMKDGRCYVPNYEGNSITIVSMSDDLEVETLNHIKKPRSIADVGDQLVVCSEENSIKFLDPRKKHEVANCLIVAHPTTPFKIGENIYLSQKGGASVCVLDASLRVYRMPVKGDVIGLFNYENMIFLLHRYFNSCYLSIIDAYDNQKIFKEINILLNIVIDEFEASEKVIYLQQKDDHESCLIVVYIDDDYDISIYPKYEKILGVETDYGVFLYDRYSHEIDILNPKDKTLKTLIKTNADEKIFFGYKKWIFMASVFDKKLYIINADENKIIDELKLQYKPRFMLIAQAKLFIVTHEHEQKKLCYAIIVDLGGYVQY